MLLPPVKTHSDYANEYTSTLKSLHKTHQMLTVVYLPLVITCLGMSCFFAYVHGAANKYTDPGEDYEACWIVNNALQVPLQPIFNQIQTKVTTALGCTVSQPVCSSNCTTAIINKCILPLISNGPVIPSVPAVPLPIGQMLEGLTYVGFQAVIFSMVAHGALNRALRHPSWLPATISLLIWCSFAMITYYTVNPFLPVPAQTNSTVIIFLDYFRKKIFDNIPAADGSTNHCDKAFRISWAYLAVILAIVLNVLCSLGVAVKAEIARHVSPYKKAIQHLEGTIAPVVCCSTSIFFYIIIVICKIQNSLVALKSIRDYDLTQQQAFEQGQRIWFTDSFFPFQKGNLDITTILFVAAFMSTIRGYTRSSVSAFRFASGIAFAFAITSYPGYVGAYRFYDENNFYSDSDCKDFFLQPKNAPLFGYPSDDQAETYCQSFRWSLAGATGVLACMHLLIVLAARTYSDNMHRASAIFEPLEPDASYGDNTQAYGDTLSLAKVDGHKKPQLSGDF